MRVTNKMIFDAAQLQTAAARDKLVDAQQKVTTGRRVNHPGDDPAAAGAIVTHTMSVQRLDTIDQVVSRAVGEVEMADGALQGVSSLLARVRQLAVQLGNDTYSAQERVGAAVEIRSISRQIGQAMNIQVGGRYVFGGNIDRTAPFDSAGNYVGDTAVRQIEVAPGLLQNASVRADVALKGVGGGVDVFASIEALALALDNNDGGSVRASLDSIVTSGDQVASALIQTGTILDGFLSAQSIGGVAKESAQKALASVSEIDIFDAASELAKAQQSLEAALAVSAKSFNMSLLDYLPRG